MSFTYNDVTINDISNGYQVYTSEGYGLKLWVSMFFSLQSETDTHLNISYFIQVNADAQFSGNHEGNGLSLRPYYLLEGQSAVYAEQWCGPIDADRPSNDPYTFYDNHVFSVPKDKILEKKLHFGVISSGIYINQYLNRPDVPSYHDTTTTEMFYPFFSQLSNPDPIPGNGGLVPGTELLNKDGWSDDLILPTQTPKIWYYDESGVPHKGTPYYYDENGVPHKAKVVYYYDASGAPKVYTI